MQYRVKAKQENSKVCLVCGLKNPFGLRSSFYELENDELLALFTPMEEQEWRVVHAPDDPLVVEL